MYPPRVLRPTGKAPWPGAAAGALQEYDTRTGSTTCFTDALLAGGLGAATAVLLAAVLLAAVLLAAACAAAAVLTAAAMADMLVELAETVPAVLLPALNVRLSAL
jgi:hypothetical protein